MLFFIRHKRRIYRDNLFFYLTRLLYTWFIVFILCLGLAILGTHNVLLSSIFLGWCFILMFVRRLVGLSRDLRSVSARSV